MHMRGKTICEFTVIIEDLGFEADLGFELNLVVVTGFAHCGLSKLVSKL